MTEMPKYSKRVKTSWGKYKRVELKEQRSEKLVNKLNHQLMVGFYSDLPVIWKF